MKIKCLNNATAVIPENFFEDLNPNGLTDIDSSITTRGDGDYYDHKRLMDEIRQVMLGHDNDHEQTDGLIAEILHKGLPISRRDASFSSFWHYCSIFEYLEYIKWRWLEGGKSFNRERVLGAWRRNGLGRLWWWAEITHDPALADPYNFTKRGARSQEFMLHAVDDFVGGDKGLMLAMCKEFFPKIDSKPDRNLVRSTFAKIVAVLDTIASESLSDQARIQLVHDVIEDAAGQ